MKKYVWSGTEPPWARHRFSATTQKTRTFDAVRAAGENGITREEICTKTNLPKQRVWFYLSELRRAGLIKRMGDAVDPTTLGPAESKLHAMVALENALGVNATHHVTVACTTCRAAGSDDGKRCQAFKDLSRQFLRYQKIKALALGAKTDGESTAALRAAIIDLVKMVF